jgi:hypothetical protein
MASIDLATLAAYKARYEIDDADTTRDAAITQYLTDASRAIIEHTRREFAPAVGSATRRFELKWHPEFGWWIDFNDGPDACDCRSVSGVTVDPLATAQAVDSASWQLLPISGEHQDFGPVYTELQLSSYLAPTPTSQFKFGTITVDVTGAWGFSAIPEDVSRLCCVTVRTWLNAGAPIDGSYWQDARESQPVPPAGWELPPPVLRGLQRYLKDGGAY